jgi:murein DD-endopeptidase MepM/ murein hydrolase activator NlpD
MTRAFHNESVSDSVSASGSVHRAVAERRDAGRSAAGFQALQILFGGAVFGVVATLGLGAGAETVSTETAQTAGEAAPADTGTAPAAAPRSTEATSPPSSDSPPSSEASPTTAPPPVEPAPDDGGSAPDESTESGGDSMQSSVVGGGPTTTTLTDEQRAERDRVMANLNLARAADQEIANELRSITSDANQTIEKIEAARQRIEEAEAIREQSSEQLAESGERQIDIEESLRVRAVEGYKSRSVGNTSLLFVQLPVSAALRQDQLLNEANDSTADLLEELRGLVEDRRLASLQAERAAQEAQLAEAQLQAELEAYQEQLSTQLVLKSEAERRIDDWAGELTAYAAEDAGIQNIIGERAEQVDTAINNPTTPSELGFQWPVEEARVTSEYGYRTHPVYGTRRLHAGIDLGAPRGTPISASNDGTAIFVGPRGGYGRTVMIDHGGGITTLYAHMTDYNISEGATVNRGDIVGFVGSTGTATGNHLHFEVRVNGGAVNPRGYLP